MTKKYQVLMVDDQRWWYETMLPNLQILNCEVKYLQTAKSAIEDLKTNLYDLLIVDLRLDETKEYNTEGLDILEFLVKAGKTLPVIVLSGHINDGLRQKIMWLKAFAILEKTGDANNPKSSFKQELFVETVKKALALV